MKFKQWFMSDKKRYGIKYTKMENIITFICTFGALALATALALSNDETTKLFYGAMALFILYWIPYMAYYPAYKRRIRELGGDVLHKVDKHEDTTNR